MNVSTIGTRRAFTSDPSEGEPMTASRPLSGDRLDDFYVNVLGATHVVVRGSERPLLSHQIDVLSVVLKYVMGLRSSNPFGGSERARDRMRVGRGNPLRRLRPEKIERLRELVEVEGTLMRIDGSFRCLVPSEREAVVEALHHVLRPKAHPNPFRCKEAVATDTDEILRTAMVRVRMTPAERSMLEEEARSRGLSLSGMMRTAVISYVRGKRH